VGDGAPHADRAVIEPSSANLTRRRVTDEIANRSGHARRMFLRETPHERRHDPQVVMRRHYQCGYSSTDREFGAATM
jgi:hypothetical protein